MSTLLELAERCEQAVGPDRDLDAAIMDALHIGEYRTKNGLLGYPLEPKPYTTSLDAAMTLATGFGGEVTFFKDGTAKAYLWQPYPLAIEARATSAALALCAAALKARAAQAIEAQRAETVKQGSVADESAVAISDAPIVSPHSTESEGE